MRTITQRFPLTIVSLLSIFLLASSIPLTSFAASRVSYSASSAISPSSYSCGYTVSHENSKNDAIQLALDAAARSKVSPIVVCVASGTFPEQLNITSRGGISLVGRGTWKNPTILEPKSVIVNNYDNILGGAFAQAAIILAGNNGTSAIIRNINVRNIVINGDGARSSIDKYRSVTLILPE